MASRATDYVAEIIASTAYACAGNGESLIDSSNALDLLAFK